MCQEYGGFAGKEKARFGIAAIALFCSLVLSIDAKATLLFALRCADRDVYMASDGVVTGDGGQVAARHIKCFPISDTGCVALAGFSGKSFSFTNVDATRQTAIQLDLLLELERMSAEQTAQHLPFLQCVTNITRRFLIRYNVLWQLDARSAAFDASKTEVTALLFEGYDANAAAYMNATALFQPTNSTAAQLHIGPTPFAHFTAVGVQDFIMAALSGKDARLSALTPAAIHQGFLDMASTNRVVDGQEMSRLILDLFAFHRKYAGQYGFAEGNVGPPYVIYRISPTNVTPVYYSGAKLGADETVVDITVGTIVFIILFGVIIFAVKVQ